jgi:hypothetical protein
MVSATQVVKHAADYLEIVDGNPGYTSSFNNFLITVNKPRSTPALSNEGSEDDRTIYPGCLAMLLKASGGPVEQPTILHASCHPHDEWIVDSRTNTHLATRPHWFRELSPTHEEANGASSAIPLQGQGPIDMRFAKTNTTLILADTLFSTSARVNILSLSKLGKAGMHGT